MPVPTQRDSSAALALVRQSMREPVAPGARVIDPDQVYGVCLRRTDELSTVGLPGADAAEVDDLGVAVYRHVATAIDS